MPSAVSTAGPTGDEFYVNYVGHPMQGCVVGFLWVGSDVHYRHAEFGKSPVYWKSRLRAAAFAWALQHAIRDWSRQ